MFYGPTILIIFYPYKILAMVVPVFYLIVANAIEILNFVVKVGVFTAFEALFTSVQFVCKQSAVAVWVEKYFSPL